MNILTKTLLCFALLQSVTGVHALEFTGRFSMLGTTARAEQGDSGYINKNNSLTADQQSLRLMLDDAGNKAEWSAHIKTTRLHLSDIPFSDTHSSDLFRHKEFSSYWIDENETSNSTHLGYELDRAVYKHQFAQSALSIGRQPIDWGSGQFWQPLNVFGAFAPTDLDTDYKPGIDAIRFDWFPSGLSSLGVVLAFSPDDIAGVTSNSNTALHYRRQVAEQDQLTLVVADVIGNTVIGASYDGAWGGMGWRIEAAQYEEENGNDFTFWIAGLSYQFENGTLLNLEWYDNSRGAKNINELLGTDVLNDTLIKYGLQQQLTRNLLAVSLNKDLSPLWNGGYVLLASPLKDSSGDVHTSLYHQFNFTYSVSNESDLLFSLQKASGRGATLLGQPQSEFGHLPASLTLRLRFYF